MIDNEFSAEKMFDIASKARRKFEKREFEDAVEKIITAAESGSMKILIPLAYDNTIIALNDLRFQINIANYVTSSTDSEFYNYYEVSWNNKE